MIQREMRQRRFPLLERLERMNQKECEFEKLELSKEMTINSSSKSGSLVIGATGNLFTKLALLNNKRRQR